MVADLTVQCGLSEQRLVRLVVTILTEADDIHDGIGAKGVAVLESNLRSQDDRFRCVAIHMEDRGFDGLRNFRTVTSTACFIRLGRKSNLVVDD